MNEHYSLRGTCSSFSSSESVLLDESPQEICCVFKPPFSFLFTVPAAHQQPNATPVIIPSHLPLSRAQNRSHPFSLFLFLSTQAPTRPNLLPTDTPLPPAMLPLAGESFVCVCVCVCVFECGVCLYERESVCVCARDKERVLHLFLHH